MLELSYRLQYLLLFFFLYATRADIYLDDILENLVIFQNLEVFFSSVVPTSQTIRTAAKGAVGEPYNGMTKLELPGMKELILAYKCMYREISIYVILFTTNLTHSSL